MNNLMLQTHPNLVVPDLAAMLWRYVDLAKLVFLFEHRALWFSRVDSLGDPYEGLPTRPLVDDMWALAKEASEPDRLQRIEVASHNTRAFGQGRQALAVSCWHVSSVESAAMWSLYARLGEGIAIKTTFERF
jgi:hypothetical protein